MKKSFLIPAVLLAACGSKPVPPDWQANSFSSIQQSTSRYLKGETEVAETEFARARREAAATGKPSEVAQLELVRCAARVASLDISPCTGYEALAQDATPAQHAYAAYLAGRWQGLDVNVLPEQHRKVVTSGTIGDMSDPLAALVAAGALMQANRITPGDIARAAETASQQGWRRPVLAWLGIQLKRAEAAGDTASAAQLRRRIGLAEQTE
jgi:hypothetical protein